MSQDKPGSSDMMAMEVFHFEQGKTSFEDFGKENGFRHWFASDLAAFLGYENYETFRKAVNRAMAACATLNIPCEENFQTIQRAAAGKAVADFKLSRFACYLTAMNGDVKKPKVAAAQAYFAAVAESFQLYLEDAENIDRLNLRDDVTKGEKSLSGVANQAHVHNYAFFQNAGYRGMYNMNMGDLKKYKRHTGEKTLLDYMGREELAAHHFRITQTEMKLKNEGISGQGPCEVAAHSVGKLVRKTMMEISGTAPEDLPLKTDIAGTRKNLKKSSKEFKKLDGH